MSASKSHLHRYDAPAASHRPTNMSELSILLKHHQFIRDEAEDSDIDPSKLSWEDKVSLSWYNKLFREYAVCDLTQYKTGGIALRWRTEEEVLQRAGEVSALLPPDYARSVIDFCLLPTADLRQSALQVS